MSDAIAHDPAAIMACHECGMLHRVRPLAPGTRARCNGCGAGLYADRANAMERSLALTLTALALFVIANAYPFITFKLEGRAETSLLLTGTWRLYQDGLWPLAVVVFLAATLFPLLKLLGTLYVLLPLRFDLHPPGLARVFRWVEVTRTWAMMEVYLLGVIVAWVKLKDLAQLELGIGLYAFVALILVFIAAEAVLDPRQLWVRLGPQASPASLRRSGGGAFWSCHECDQLYAIGHHDHDVEVQCGRCGAALHHRKPDSLTRTWALLFTAMILYVPANVLPVMTVISFGEGEPDTILSGVKVLIEVGMWPVAALVFFASITVPVLKMIGLTGLLLSVQFGSRWRPRERTLIYRIIESVGRWSMVDIFMISILVALVNLGSIATIEPGAGAIAFAAVVITTMLASMSFDPRLIWDVQEDHRARA